MYLPQAMHTRCKVSIVCCCRSKAIAYWKSMKFMTNNSLPGHACLPDNDTASHHVSQLKLRCYTQLANNNFLIQMTPGTSKAPSASWRHLLHNQAECVAWSSKTLSLLLLWHNAPSAHTTKLSFRGSGHRCHTTNNQQ